MDIAIVVPIYNEEKVLERWLPQLYAVARRLGAGVILVDDGSLQPVPAAAVWPEALTVVLLRHSVNCGVGAALGTGIDCARALGATKVLTIDADGQHDPGDLEALLKILQKGEADLVNGSRFLHHQRVPFTRRMANGAANLVTLLLAGHWISDSQSGMKGFSERALSKLAFAAYGYDWCSEIFREAREERLRVTEVPISVQYSSYSLSKGQNFAKGLDLMARLVLRSLSRPFKKALSPRGQEGF